MLIDQSRQILRFFNSMPEGMEYVMREGVWEQYQQAREQHGWGRAGVRTEYRLVRQGKQLRLNQNLVWDFERNPQSDAFATATFATATFAFAPTAFAFAFCAHVAFAFEPLNQPTPPPTQTQLEEIGMVWNGLSERLDLEGKPGGFWHEPPGGEIPSLQIAGEIQQSGRVGLCLHNLTEDQAAHILAMLR